MTKHVEEIMTKICKGNITITNARNNAVAEAPTIENESPINAPVIGPAKKDTKVPKRVPQKYSDRLDRLLKSFHLKQ